MSRPGVEEGLLERIVELLVEIRDRLPEPQTCLWDCGHADCERRRAAAGKQPEPLPIAPELPR